MPWSKPVVEQLSLVDRSTKEESDWYGPFTTLMFELFPLSEEYRVSPQPKRIKGSEEFAVRYVVRKGRTHLLCRDQNIIFSRQRLTEPLLTLKCATTSMASYPTPFRYQARLLASVPSEPNSPFTHTTNTRSFEPPAIAADPNVIKEIAPEERWCFDFLDDEGEVKLREVVAAVKAMASNL
ncbi:hypothetical protein OG21DRAFT_1509852 [Imleria badia]|nr:hypothetical protein OG21DRAFT_1509852 [Imleria badia]